MMRFSFSAARRRAPILTMTAATLGVIAAASLSLAPRAACAQIAADNAANAPYGNGWQTGDNGGFGYAPWTLTSTGNAGFFINNSNRNGGGSGNNTPNIGGPAFQLAAVSGGTASALRFFSSPLQPGQAFTLQFDNGFVADGSSVGFELVNSAGVALFQFAFTGAANGNRYTVLDNSGLVDTGVNRTGGGLDTRFEISATNQYLFTTTRRDNQGSFTGTGTLISSVAQDVSGVRLFNNNAAGNFTNRQIEFELYANNMITVAPEPGTLALLLPGFGALGAVAFRARRRKR